MGVAEPVSSGKSADVEILLVAQNCTTRLTGVAHLAELISHFVDCVKVALAHLDPVSDTMAGLIGVFRRAETLGPVVRRVVPVRIEEVIRLDQEAWHIQRDA